MPRLLHALGAVFYVSFASRIMIYAIAATSLNLILGYGGMVTLRPRRVLRRGAYAVGIVMAEGVQSAGAHLLRRGRRLGVAALAIGAISLRTRGVYFIMITLAFAQMMFYLASR